MMSYAFLIDMSPVGFVSRQYVECIVGLDLKKKKIEKI